MREGMMDDCGYRGFEECGRYEDCCKDAYEQGRADAIEEILHLPVHFFAIDGELYIKVRDLGQLKE